VPLFLPSLSLVLICWTVSSSIWIYPHSLSYFNESIGGPLNGPDHLLGSNVDWGQDIRYLQWWFDGDVLRHSPCGACLGKSATVILELPMESRRIGLASTPSLNWCAASVTLIHESGELVAANYTEQMEELASSLNLRNQTPSLRMGMSILLYRIKTSELKDDSCNHSH
jgi:hypothetical protein